MSDPQRLALLAVGDTESIPTYTRHFLPARFVVEHAQTGPEALAKALRRPPDVAVVESSLPLIDGYALCAILRREPSTMAVPVLVVTSEPPAAAAERGRLAGVTALLQKAHVETRLGDEIRRLCYTRPPQGSASGRLSAECTGSPRGVRAQQDATTVPTLPPPAIRCPQCDAVLKYERSFVGGVRRSTEQWDQFLCPRGCGVFEYRQRTRRIRRVGTSGPVLSRSGAETESEPE